jgi:ABC-type multidrug transport system ATPase subunit
MIASTTVLEARGISLSYGRLSVLRGINLTFHAGDLCLLLGANGSGKSSLLRVCAGLTTPQKGTLSSPAVPEGRRSAIGHVGHSSLLYPGLTVHENLSFYRSLYGTQIDLDAELDAWDLVTLKHKMVRDLSKGMQARAGLCRAFLNRPRILLLDEPSSSLDEHGIALLGENLRRLFAEAPDVFALIATHDIHRLIGLANRAVVLGSGVVVADSREDEVELETTVEEYQRHNR